MTAARRATARLLAGGDQILDRVGRAVGDASRTVKFLRGALGFEGRADDVFVASYPRSGTTWTQLIVHLLVRGGRGIDFAHISQVCPWWERSLAWGSASAGDLDRLPSPRVFKTHLPRRWLPARGRCVYLRRDPADVASSYYRLYCDYLGFDGSFDAFFARFLRGDVQYGSWFKHVAAWDRRAGDPDVLTLDYEAMRRSPADAVAALAGFLGVDADDARIAEVAAASDLEVMKAHEDRFDHTGELRRTLGLGAGRFIGDGRVGGGRRRLGDDQRAALERRQSQAVTWPEIEWRLPDFLH